MRNTKQASIRIICMTLVFYQLIDDWVYAQVITGADKDRWFFSRLPGGGIFGFLLGLFITFLWFRRIRYDSEELSLNRKVQKACGWALFFTFIALGALLLMDAWLVYDFGGTSLTFVEAISEVLLTWKTLVILVLALVAFYVAAVLCTRLSRTFSGRYALWWGPKAG